MFLEENESYLEQDKIIHILKITRHSRKENQMTKHQREKKAGYRNRSSIAETLGLSDRDFMITIIGKEKFCIH